MRSEATAGFLVLSMMMCSVAIIYTSYALFKKDRYRYGELAIATCFIILAFILFITTDVLMETYEEIGKKDDDAFESTVPWDDDTDEHDDDNYHRYDWSGYWSCGFGCECSFTAATSQLLTGIVWLIYAGAYDAFFDESKFKNEMKEPLSNQEQEGVENKL